MNPEQLQEIITALCGGTRKHKIEKPDVFRVERSKLQGWLSQLGVYFKAVGWAVGLDEEKVLYTTSLLTDDAGTWVTLIPKNN